MRMPSASLYPHAAVSLWPKSTMTRPADHPAQATAHFIAYPSHPSLRSDVLQLIANLESGTREAQKSLAARVLETAAREVLQVMVVDLVQRLQRPDRPSAEIHKTLRYLDDYIGGFCRLLSGMLSNDKLMRAMRYFRTVLMDIDDAQGQPQPWIGFPVDDSFAAELRAVCAHLRDANAPYDAARTVQALDALTDAVLHALLEAPRDLMQFGFVIRKAADGGIAVARSAMRGMTHRSIPYLSARQRRGLADHLDSMLHELPATQYT